MEIRGLATVQKVIDPNMDVFEAFKIMQEINRLKGLLEKTLKGNKSVLGVKTVVEDAFKPNQMIIHGTDGKIIRSLIKQPAKVIPECQYYTYKLELV
jgi:hypothetical protein